MKKWYALAVQAGQEKRVRERILQRLEKRDQSVPGMQIVAPEEEVIVRSRGEANRKRRMSMPGYLLFHTRTIPDPALVVISGTSGAWEFLGGNDNPTPLPESEVVKIIGDGGTQKRETESLFQKGDSVMLIEGPLADFSGYVLEVFPDRDEARVEVEIFGRRTPSTVPLRSLRPS